MPLTAEQIKLMEENRRKALEKRAAAKKAEANQVMNKNQSNVFVGKAAVSPSSPFNPSEVKNNTSTSSFYSKSQSSTGGGNQHQELRLLFLSCHPKIQSIILQQTPQDQLHHFNWFQD